MAKTKVKTVFFCKECGAESPKWVGKCPSCGEWNTYIEEVISKKASGAITSTKDRNSKPQKLKDVVFGEEKRMDTKNNELNRILGGGLVPGSVVLIGGEPGIGKSTLALQVALNCIHFKTLYISGEESEKQIKLRADRINTENDNCYVLSETSLENIFLSIHELKPNLIVIDSIQTLSTEYLDSTAGSVSQIRECTSQLLKYSKENSVPTILIGHITKDGSLAGPKILEHIVDAVLTFEGDQNHLYRILRTNKNRFGSASELAIFEMQSSGLREVSNPSEILITKHEDDLSGIAIAATLDGVRPFLIETQALVSTAAYGTPQRSATGFDTRRLNMLLAVLEKRANFKLATKDVFLNLAGGLKIKDPAIDLALVASVLSSSVDIPISQRLCFAGEVGLSGEVRPVQRIEQRISEAEKLGFSQIVISSYNTKGLDLSKYKIEIKMVSKIEHLVKLLFA